MLKRVLKSGGAEDSGSIDAIEYNKYAGAQKKLDVGPALNILGTCNSGLSLPGLGTSLWIYNNSSSIAYVAFYDANGAVPSAPSSLSNGIALAPNSYTKLNSGQYSGIIGSAATIGVYQVIDDSQLNNVQQ
jgi:hypothetical protein